MFEPSVAILFSTVGVIEVLCDANFDFFIGGGKLCAFDRVRLAIQFFAFISTGTSSSLLISIGSSRLLDLDVLWRFNLFADAVFPLVAISADGPLNSRSSCCLLFFRFDTALSTFSIASAACFSLPRRYECDDSKLSRKLSSKEKIMDHKLIENAN